MTLKDYHNSEVLISGAGCELQWVLDLIIFTSHHTPYSLICQALGAISTMKSAMRAKILFYSLLIIFD